MRALTLRFLFHLYTRTTIETILLGARRAQASDQHDVRLFCVGMLAALPILAVPSLLLWWLVSGRGPGALLLAAEAGAPMQRVPPWLR